MTRWSTRHFDLDDDLNRAIWSSSPEVQARVEPPRQGREGDVGVAQALVGSPPLPWVPDLVGRRWREPGAVLVVGSAYADFFSPLARRGGRMNLGTYQRAGSAAAFQRAFLREVVDGDGAYYEPVADLLERAGVAPDRLVLTDLCRASFVAVQDGSAKAGDRVVRQHADLFHRYVEANAPWHRRRIVASGARVIVALGGLAARGVCWLLDHFGWRRQGSTRAARRNRGAGWMGAAPPTRAGCAYVGLDGRRVTVLPVPHPSAWGEQSPADGAPALARLLGTSAGDAPVPEPPPSAPRRSPPRGASVAQASRAPTASTDALWRAAFKPAKTLEAAELLAGHPDAAALTEELLAGLSARRMVAITNALYNPCRPDRLRSRGAAAREEESWQILLERKDSPYSRAGTKWERLLEALEPMPDWAAERLHGMDIVQLGSVVRAIRRGPYNAM